MPVVELTKDNFEQTVTGHDFIIVDYWAPWCGPCRSFMPVFEKVAQDHPEILFAKVNTEEEQEIASQFNIGSVPTLMILRERIIVYNKAGALPEPALRELIARAAALDMEEARKQVGDAAGG
ncbi:MAG TPA: thioredoxin [Sedimenticola sp.]|nr:thioredoxin [Sedimenticola sp.]